MLYFISISNLFLSNLPSPHSRWCGSKYPHWMYIQLSMCHHILGGVDRNCRRRYNRSAGPVTTFAVVWIEINLSLIDSMIHLVTTFAVVWIEIVKNHPATAKF